MYQECNFAKNRTYEEVLEGFLPNLAGYYAAPSEYRMEPFRIYGNLYYVGDKKVCAHLVDTGDGLILFDTGYRHALHILISSIEKLGFRPDDIRYIIHSHGHFDHFGGGNEMRRMYGCKILMSKADSDLLRENPERALLCYSPLPADGICWPDEELQDGDTVTLGNTSVRCLLTPGHTGGTMTFFFGVAENGASRNVGYMGGVGFLSMFRAFCREYGLPGDACEKLGESIRRVYDIPVDIVLGNHPSHNCTVEKREWMLSHPGENPFVNPDAWHIFLDALEARRRDFDSRGL